MTDLTITASAVALVKEIESVTLPVGEAITAGQVARLTVATGLATKANGTSKAEARAFGVAIRSSRFVNEAVTFLKRGYLDLGAALDAIALDAPIYLSDTDGTLADAPGAIAVPIGRVVPAFGQTTADRLLYVDVPTVAPHLRVTLVAGGAAGDHTVTGIALGDDIVFVGHLSTAAAIATLADLTSEFSITAADTINNTDGTDTTNDQLMVIWQDLT